MPQNFRKIRSKSALNLETFVYLPNFTGRYKITAFAIFQKKRKRKFQIIKRFSDNFGNNEMMA